MGGGSGGGGRIGSLDIVLIKCSSEKWIAQMSLATRLM